MTATNLIWTLSGVISYKDGTWKAAEIRSDYTGFFQTGPNIGQFPEVIKLLTELGLVAPPAVADPTVKHFVFRFSALHTSRKNKISVAGDNERITAFGDQRAIAALEADRNFRAYFKVTTTPNTPLGILLGVLIGPVTGPGPEPEPEPGVPGQLVTDDGRFFITNDGLRIAT